MKKYDYLIVGAGLSGIVLAERLSNIGKSILLIEQRNHIGGNCYDYIDNNGILVSKYGFHGLFTNKKSVINYLLKFTKLSHFNLIVKSSINNELYDFPINRNTINKVFKTNLKEQDIKKFINLLKVCDGTDNSRNKITSQCGVLLYEKFFKNYNIKLWGISPEELDSFAFAHYV